jgi:hypothetical protein
VNAIAEGRLTYVFKNGIISAPELGAVTTRTSCEYSRGSIIGVVIRHRKSQCGDITFVSRKIV